MPLHQTVLTAFNGLFTDLDNQLKKHLQSFQASVDSSESAIIESNYLNDTEQDIRDDYRRLDEEQETVRQIIASVSDISSADHPFSWTLDSNKEDAVRTITELEEELTSFTSEGSQQIAQTEDLLHQIEVTLNKAGAVKGDARFTDYKSTSTTVGLAALQDYNAEKREARLEKAKEAMDSAIKDLNERSQEVLNKAYTDLENGEINSEKFNSILSAVKKTNGNISDDELKDGRNRTPY